MKTFLECVEKTLAVMLSVSSCLGMFLIGIFFGNIFFGGCSTDAMWVIFLISLFLTWAAGQLWMQVRYHRLLILAEEQALRDDPDANGLYEHLTQGL